MVLGLGVKLAILFGIPLAGAAIGGGIFFAADGTLEATGVDLHCSGMPNPADDAMNSQLLVETAILDLSGWYDIPNNVCHTLAVGDVGQVDVQSRVVELRGVDGACKWHSETGFDC